MAMLFQNLLRFSVPVLTVVCGRSWSIGWVRVPQILHGSHWRNSSPRTQIFSLRMSCFKRRGEVLWTLSLGRCTTGGRRRHLVANVAPNFSILWLGQ
uniref:Secreted protein n=1 Tax=Setaria viridis TaxID=4556 RepID=A0A4U6W6P2_SETVI|nr:hypothetical protein SEVIR_2G215933v2 [Setaria viridis]